MALHINYVLIADSNSITTRLTDEISLELEAHLRAINDVVIATVCAFC